MVCDNILMIPIRGTRSHSGRNDSSCSISFNAFSSRKNVSKLSAASGSDGHSR